MGDIQEIGTLNLILPKQNCVVTILPPLERELDRKAEKSKEVCTRAVYECSDASSEIIIETHIVGSK